MSSEPYALPTSAPSSGYDIATVIQPLADRAGWLKFIGIWMIIVGVMYCLTILGAIVGVPVIIAGLNLSQGAGMLRGAYTNDAHQLREACQKMSTSAYIMGILLAISLALTALYIVAMIALVVIGGIGGAMNR